MKSVKFRQLHNLMVEFSDRYMDYRRTAEESGKFPMAYDAWLISHLNTTLAEAERLRESSELTAAYARMLALGEELNYNFFSENHGGHGVELGIWGIDGAPDRVVSASGETLAAAINEAVRKWEASEWNVYTSILPCYHCGKIHHPDLPCPGTKRESDQ